MIQSTFLHLPRTGVRTEQRLCGSGITSWKAFMQEPKLRGFSPERKEEADKLLVQSNQALAKGDSAFFRTLPRPEHWRLYSSFADEAIYVDIETNWQQDITVLGIYDGRTVKHFIKGSTLTRQAIKEHLQGKLIVTYNGASFDLPVINRCFPGILPEIPHFDTMHLARRLGYRGGLKMLEMELGIRRPDKVEGMSGEDALHLWSLYRASGEEAYLQRLLAYNEEDIVNLVTVARKLVRQAKEQMQLPTQGL